MAKRPAPQVAPKSFELAISELEQILTDMEDEQVGLEESLGKYERGTYLLQWCRGVLGEAERKIEVMSRGPDGQVESTPLDEADDPEA